MDNKEIIDYKILAAAKTWELAEQVKDELEDGWKLFGSPCVDDQNLYQAMVKYEERESR